MAEFDHGIKLIAETTGRQLARLAGLSISDWRPAESTVQSVENLADRVFIAGRGRNRFVVHFEFYTRWDRDAPWDMLAKSGMLSKRERLPTKCIAVVLRRAGFRSLGGQFRLEASGGPTQQLWFEELCLWTQKPQPWWEDEPGLMALYPLCDHGRRPREAITHAADTIEAKVPADGEQGNFLALLGIFGRLSYPQLDARKIIGVEKMKESKFYQEVMQEGELIRLRTDILRVLRVRLRVTPPVEVAAALDQFDDPAVLDPLLDLAITCADLDAFRAGLPQRQTV